MQAGDNDVEDTSEPLPNQGTLAALVALVEAIRDNVYLEPKHLDELIDMQPDGTHAKQLVCALAILGVVPCDDADMAIISHELRSE